MRAQAICIGHAGIGILQSTNTRGIAGFRPCADIGGARILHRNEHGACACAAHCVAGMASRIACALAANAVGAEAAHAIGRGRASLPIVLLASPGPITSIDARASG